jgi:hypothetical protein
MGVLYAAEGWGLKERKLTVDFSIAAVCLLVSGVIHSALIDLADPDDDDDYDDDVVVVSI